MKTTSSLRYILFQGTSIYYQIRSPKQTTSDTPAILMLHPAFSDHSAFNRQFEMYGEQCILIAPDLLGHGQSHPFGRYKEKLESTPDHLMAILVKEGIKQVHLVGVSMGSLLAQFMAWKHPETILSLTSIGGYYIHENNNKVMLAQLASNVRLVLISLFSLEAFRRKVARISTYTSEARELFYKSSKGFRRKSFQAMQGIQHVVQERKEISYSFPLYILVGEFDLPLAKKLSLQWHEKFPESSYSILKGMGHCANMDSQNDIPLFRFPFLD